MTSGAPSFSPCLGRHPPPSPPMAALLAALQPAAPIPVPPHTDTADTDPASSSRSATASTSVPCSGAASQPSHPVASASSPPSASDPVTASAAAASDPDPGPDPAGPSGAQGLHSASAEPAPTPSLGVRPQRDVVRGHRRVRVSGGVVQHAAILPSGPVGSRVFAVPDARRWVLELTRPLCRCRSNTVHACLGAPSHQSVVILPRFDHQSVVRWV